MIAFLLLYGLMLRQAAAVTLIEVPQAPQSQDKQPSVSNLQLPVPVRMRTAAAPAQSFSSIPADLFTLDELTFDNDQKTVKKDLSSDAYGRTSDDGIPMKRALYYKTLSELCLQYIQQTGQMSAPGPVRAMCQQLLAAGAAHAWLLPGYRDNAKQNKHIQRKRDKQTINIGKELLTVMSKIIKNEKYYANLELQEAQSKKLDNPNSKHYFIHVIGNMHSNKGVLHSDNDHDNELVEAGHIMPEVVNVLRHILLPNGEIVEESEDGEDSEDKTKEENLESAYIQEDSDSAIADSEINEDLISPYAEAEAHEYYQPKAKSIPLSIISCINVTLNIEQDNGQIVIRKKSFPRGALLKLGKKPNKEPNPSHMRLKLVKKPGKKPGSNLSKFRPMGGRKEWVSIGDRHDKRQPWLII